MKGTVKKWLKDKGYGFIEPEEGGEDAFVRWTNVQRAYELREGQIVKFEVQGTSRGLKAFNVILIE